MTTASALKALRETTGASLAQCREALAASGGDVERALDWLSEAGLYEAAELTRPKLRAAIARNEHARVARWIAHGGSANDKLGNESLLSIACQSGAIETARVLVAAGATTNEVVRGVWLPKQLPILRELSTNVHPGLLLQALIASLSERALASGTDAVVELAERLGPEKLETRPVVLRIVSCGVGDLIERWRDPSAILASALTTEERSSISSLLPQAPTTVRELFEAHRARTRRGLAFFEEQRRANEFVDPIAEAACRASAERFERATEWLAAR